MKDIWRIAVSILFILLIFIATPIFYTLFSLIPHLGKFLANNPSILQHFVMILVSCLLMTWIAKGNRKDYGLTLSWKFPVLRVVSFSIALGLIATLIIILLDFSTGSMPAEGMSMLQRILFVWLLASIAEETLFRGLIQGYLAPLKIISLKIGNVKLTLPVIVAALFFALVHLMLLIMGVYPGVVLLIVIFGFILGLLAGYYKEATGSLLPAFIVHACFNIGGSLPGLFF